MECIELNWLCKHMKKFKSSQASSISIVVLKTSKTQFFPMSWLTWNLDINFCVKDSSDKHYLNFLVIHSDLQWVDIYSISRNFSKFIYVWFNTHIYRNMLIDNGCRAMFLFAVFYKIGAMERNIYWFHVKLIFIVIFG